LTPDTHPMHTHLVQFQIGKRMEFNAEQYLADWTALNGG
jgi:FtsP/CotA-like multicopper oxidase with cupredoxin domain